MSSKTLFGMPDVRVGLLAALFKNGGQFEVTYEELGEAVIADQFEAVSIAIERTATGAVYRVVPKGGVS